MVSVVREDDGARVVEMVTDDVAAVACPACGVVSVSVKERTVTRPTEALPAVEPTQDAVAN